MPSAIPSLNVGGVQPPYDPISSAAGSIQAVNPNELTITAGGTLQFVSGPVIPITNTTQPLIVNANTAYPTTGINNNTDVRIVGSDGGNPIVVIESFGGIPQWRTRRMDGTEGSPSPVLSGDITGQFGFAGAVDSTGTKWSTAPGINCTAIENFTTAAQGTKLGLQAVGQGGTAVSTYLTITGATGAKAVQVTGGLSIDQAGTFIANGTTAVTVAATGVTANSVIIPSVNTAGGTLTYPPHVGTITAGTNFTMIGAALDTSTYNYVIIN